MSFPLFPMRQLLSLFAFSLLGVSITLAEPTSEREWTSTAGTKINAVATSIKGGSAHLKTSEGREILVPLDKLVEADRSFITEHFANVPLEGSDLASATNLAFPAGEVTGPITTGDSSYFVYIPTSLREGRAVPMIFYTGAGGARAKDFRNFTVAAEIAGWIVAASVESSNGPLFPEGNYDHAKACYDDLLERLPIDPKRVYFTGNSGGGAMSLLNSDRLNGAGAMPSVGYLLSEASLSKKSHYYITGGASDYNRYLTARINKEAGKNGFHRFNPGGHRSPGADQNNDGILWLNSRYLAEQDSPDFDGEKADFYKALIEWLRTIKEEEPYRAYYWANFHRESDPVFTLLADQLAKDPNNVKFAEGLVALDQFSKKILATEGQDSGSVFKHTSPTIDSAADELATTYSGVPEIEEIAKALKNPTAEAK